MKIALLGYGTEGQAALDYWGTPEKANQITVCDQNDVPVPEGVSLQTGQDYLKQLNQFDLLVRSPGLYPGDIVRANPDSPDILNKVTSVTNEFFKVCPTKNIIGITGTKGKGTTSTLVAELLRAVGKTVHLGGNIGVAPLAMLQAGITADSWVVLELSSFQLLDLQTSPKIATCLMVVPEHLNWHRDMDEYLAAKQQLFAHQSADELVIFNRANTNSCKVVSASPAQTRSYEVPALGMAPQQTTGAYVKDTTIYMNDTPICDIADVALLGRHNLENVCAAIATVWDLVEHNTELISSVLRTFKGLEHRLEFVREVGDVRYYDDSFGTTPETASVAIQAFDQPKVIILGGSDKQVSFDGLAQMVASQNVRSVVLIGETAPQIEQALRQAGFTAIVAGGTDMTSIVATAQSQAQPGDIVLLSTGCASFGLFKDYKDRGQQFKTAVTALQ